MKKQFTEEDKNDRIPKIANLEFYAQKEKKTQ